MATQKQLALQMIQQLRILDPSISAEIGTPERKIIDTVAQALADNQVDLSLLSGALDIDAKFGADLDRFLAIFGFGRQRGVQASGFVTLSRVTASNYDINIPRGTAVVAPSIASGSGTIRLTFLTTEPVTLAKNTLSVTAPIRCAIPGSIGNVAANTITQFGQTPIPGVTTVANESATTNGLNEETDDQFKIRFKNTAFRNLAGTSDQYLALAVSSQYTTKANVVGPISRYREYIQVPDVDDASADPDSGITGNGPSGEYTSALSTVPYSKHIYDSIPYHVASSDVTNPRFYRQDIDFVLNTSTLARDKGDTYRQRIEASGDNPADKPFQPNLTFLSVYTGTDADVESLRPKDVVLFEHSYLSNASRNNWDRQILNCVDVFINGRNKTPATAVIPRPSGTQNLFTGSTGDRLYIENFRRVGEPNRRPVLGNIFVPLYWQPVLDLPESIVTSDATYRKGIHYWPVEDVTEIGGTVRARNGIEWSTGVGGIASEADEYPYDGPKITGTADTSIEVENYFYDRNIVDLQVASDANKQVTTDVLAHQATLRYFKFDVTVMYSRGSSQADVNQTINEVVSDYLSGQYFGSVIQLSDILQVIHNAPGVDNVRWSKEILDAQSLSTDTTGNARDRIVECDVNGKPLRNVIIDRRTAGGTSAEVQQFYLVGGATGGTYKLKLGSAETASIAYNANAATVLTALDNAAIPANTVTGAGTPTNPFVVTFDGTAAQTLMTSTSALTGGTTVYNADFILQDEELPTLPTGTTTGDTVAGLIIRPRAQNTWGQL